MFAKWIDSDGRFAFSFNNNGGIEISKEYHASLIQDESNGKCIEPGADGVPIAVDPPLPTVVELRAAKLRELNEDFEASISATKNGYPLSEMLGWDKQEKEARAYLADPNASTPFIDMISTARGIAKADLVNRIMVKVEAAEAAVGASTGKRQRLEDQLYAIADSDPDARTKIAAISWDAA
jgi:hypothetical protein